MSVEDDWTKEVSEAEEELNAKAKLMARLKSEYTHNLNKLTESYYPKMRPLHVQVYQSRKFQTYIDKEISWKAKKLEILGSTTLRQTGGFIEEMVAMKEVRERLTLEQRRAFDAAIAALTAVSKEEMSVLRKYEHPPQCVLDTIEAVYLLRGDTNFSWEDARILLCDTYYYGFFIAKAKAFDAQSVSDEVLEKLTPLILDPDFEVQQVSAASVPGGAMALWVHTIYDTAKLIRMMKSAPLETADTVRETITVLRASLQHKKDEVSGAEQKLEALQMEYEQRRKDLKHRYDQAMVPLQEAFFESHHNFTQALSSSPKKMQKQIQY